MEKHVLTKDEIEERICLCHERVLAKRKKKTDSLTKERGDENNKYFKRQKPLVDGLDALGVAHNDFYYEHRDYFCFPKTWVKPDSKGVELYNNVIKLFHENGLKEIEKERFFNKSGGVSTLGGQGYGVKRSRTGYELVLKWMGVCARVILDQCSDKRKKGEEVGGYNGYLSLYSAFKKDGIDLKVYQVQNGLEIKQQIKDPVILATDACKKGETFYHVHHLDLNSAYAAGLAKTHPELAPTLIRMYNNRKKNPRIKSVFTNAIGFMQSPYCNFQGYEYCQAELSKCAINWTHDKMLELSAKLIKKGYSPLLFNTDGVWYTKIKDGKEIESEPYTDDEIGDELGQYKNDHVDCQFRIKSKGAYEYIEKGIYKAVVRGQSKELVETFKWGDIFNKQATIVKQIKENDDNTLKEIENEII